MTSPATPGTEGKGKASHWRLRDPLIRVKARPNPNDWGDDDCMTLIEAVSVFFPHGPLTLSSFRTEIAAGRLEVARVAGKDLTTPRAIRKMVTPSRAVKPSHRDSGTAPTLTPGSSSIESGKSAQAAAAKTLTARRRRLKNTSATVTPPRSGRPILVHSQ
jgi:hypothetical protein